MDKIKYHQLAFKDGKVRKLVSPGHGEISELTTDGWTLVGFDNEAEIPANPILDNGEVREMTATEIEATKIVAENLHQAAKTLILKQAENTYFDLIDSINAVESMTVGYKDNSTVIMEKAATAGLSMTKKSYYGMCLQNAMHEIEIKGGSWHDLPEQPHNLES